MKNKTSKIVLVTLFIATLFLNYVYGSLFFSKVTGTGEAYKIGQSCITNRTSCENTYLRDYLDKISSLSSEPRTFFSTIFIQEDQLGYSGNCPCPYDSDSRGYSCGGRSSYSMDGRISYCFDTDVSDSQVAGKRASMIAGAQKSLDNAVANDLNIYHEKYTLLIIVVFYVCLWLYLRRVK